MTAIAERVRQTLRFFAAWINPVDHAAAQAHLSAAEYALFLRMSRPEQHHHLRVLRHLQAAGQSHPALLRAALLHDVGKTRYPFPLPERILVVLAKTFLPRQFATWGQAAPQGWKRPFVISAQHPEWSAEIVAEVCSDPLTLELIRRHQAPLPQPSPSQADQLLLHLKAADDIS